MRILEQQIVQAYREVKMRARYEKCVHVGRSAIINFNIFAFASHFFTHVTLYNNNVFDLNHALCILSFYFVLILFHYLMITVCMLLSTRSTRLLCMRLFLLISPRCLPPLGKQTPGCMFE